MLRAELASFRKRAGQNIEPICGDNQDAEQRARKIAHELGYRIVSPPAHACSAGANCVEKESTIAWEEELVASCDRLLVCP